MKTLSSLVAMSATAILLTGCGCFDWCNDRCCDPCPKPICCPERECCPQPRYCGDQPVDYCTPGYYPYFDPH